jgi:hypothetical protein
LAGIKLWLEYCPCSSSWEFICFTVRYVFLHDFSYWNCPTRNTTPHVMAQNNDSCTVLCKPVARESRREDFLTEPLTTGHHPTSSGLAIRADFFPICCLFYYDIVYLWYLSDINKKIISSTTLYIHFTHIWVVIVIFCLKYCFIYSLRSILVATNIDVYLDIC